MKIEILSHRGYWKTNAEKNTRRAFIRSFKKAFGAETDIRDMAGSLVVSHDPPTEGALPIDDFLREYGKHGTKLTLALNIKSDGLRKLLSSAIEFYSIENYFVFDMSIPDTVDYIHSGMNVFSRQSEYEEKPAFYKEVKGVWLDSFNGDWIDEKVICEHVERGKQVCIVSPELHRREHQVFWARLSRMDVLKSGYVMLCTDYPEDANEFFYE